MTDQDVTVDPELEEGADEELSEEEEEKARGRHEEEGEPLGAQASRLHLVRLPGALLLRFFRKVRESS